MSASSLADDLTARLARQIDLIAASFEDGNGGEASEVGDPDDVQQEEPEEEEAEASQSQSSNSSLVFLSSALSRVRNSGPSCSLEDLSSQVDAALAHQTEFANGLFIAKKSSASNGKNTQIQQVQWILNAHLTIAAWGAVLRQLMLQAEKVRDEENYWQSIEGEDSSSLLYIIQTFPVRVANALRVLSQRLRLIADSPRPPARLFSYRVVKQALPPSLLITSLFPHLAGNTDVKRAEGLKSVDTGTSRSLFFLTFSPFLLTRQEVEIKRKQLRTVRYDLARRIGGFVKDADDAFDGLVKSADTVSPIDCCELGTIIGKRLAFLESSLKKVPAHDADGNMQPYRAVRPSNPAELLIMTQQTLHKSMKAHSSSVSSQIDRLSRPSWLTRSWPWLVTTPLVSYYAYLKVYNSRATIQEYYTMAKETARGFLVDWVVEPCIKILETLRHGDGQMAIMGRESLKSDFDSLERMVADFARDQKLPSDQIAAVARRVREGDMTVVLGAYEQDLKSPLKSAVTGTLVRTLLIQVQKVKVDVDLAMDGIEKMLKSQQLTFAFVGVAPSMVLLYFASSWLRRLFSTGPSAGSKAFKKRIWYTMRSLDRILTSALDVQAVPKRLDDVSTGLLLIELAVLREFAASTAFPARDRSITEAFLDDVRELERGDTGLEVKIRVFDRLVRGYDTYLK